MSKVGTNIAGAATTAITSVITNVIAQSDAKKQQALIDHFQKMNAQQQAEIANRLNEAKDFYAQQQILFQSLSLNSNKELIKATNKKRNYASIGVGVGILILGTLIYFSKR